jgi:glycosyltransferase involved in cell wall biosynthesis
MKIAILHYTAPPLVGGVETILARQAAELVRAGHMVHILAGRGSTWDARIPVEILPRLDARYPQVLKYKTELDSGLVPEGFEDLVHQVESDLHRSLNSTDVLIAHNVGCQHRHLALTAALYNISQSGRGPRLVLWHHDLAWTRARYQNELHPGWPWDLLRTAWPGVKQVTVSEANRQALAAQMGLGLKKISLIQAGLSLGDFLGLQPRTAALVNDFHLALAAPILLTPVRISPHKNLEFGLHVLAELRQRMPDAALVVTGPVKSPMNDECLADLIGLRDRLKLGGAAILLAELMPEGLPEPSLADFFRLADALLLPSREENFGIPLLEAGLAGLPIFCSELEPLKALAGENAVYFDPDDNPRQVAALIAGRLQSDPVYLMRVRVRRQFTWEAVYRNQIAPLLEK